VSSKFRVNRLIEMNSGAKRTGKMCEDAGSFGYVIGLVDECDHLIGFIRVITDFVYRASFLMLSLSQLTETRVSKKYRLSCRSSSIAISGIFRLYCLQKWYVLRALGLTTELETSADGSPLLAK
jgi:hypothetical protein